MNALWFYLIGFILIWTLAILFRDKLKIEVQGPLLMRRTGRMRGFIDDLASGHPRFWRWTMNVGIPVAFFFMFYMLYMIVMSLQNIFVRPQASLIVPGVDIPGSPVYVPLGYGILGLATVIVVHEFAHGILARVEGVRIKSIGLLLLAVLPGAFVEPDEDDIKKVSPISKLRIYAAGSVANLILAGLCFMVFLAISSYAVPAALEADGVQIDSVVPGSPASEVLKPGLVIREINGLPANNLTTYSEALKTLKVGEVINISTDQGVIQLKTGRHPDNSTRAYMGIRTSNHLKVRENVASVLGSLPLTLTYLEELFFWVFFLNFAVGTVNLLPAKPLDGGLMFEELLRFRLPERVVRPAVSYISIFVILIIAVSIIWGTGRGLLMMF
ncbi:site-2 protease family protein [Methanothermobacter wolfeii]|uniref:site-2 protease family protein n=1 Tax=Methanothermobacter wolfeii TaxID=145261 RepID=UPI0024B333E0|nr:site-2 protease family protein [Methanothermobacter wolfeii]MDI6702635.1 site-2 protease family protein [Methanothermobacter wolfeii]MDI6841852.1 site-2 protease family protein [Methanothermobacter wolfeii]